MSDRRQTAAVERIESEAFDPRAFIPGDRRHALATANALPDRVRGAGLFADISGFTPLTETLARELGPQRGAEELTAHLNRVFHALISELDRFGGHVIYFSGDALRGVARHRARHVVRHDFLAVRRIGAGLGILVPPLTSMRLGSVDKSRSGVASGALNFARQTGSAVGASLFGSLVGGSLGFIVGAHVALLIESALLGAACARY